jgi:hypothetical protein
MLRLTQGLGWTEPRGGRGTFDRDYGTNVLRDADGWDTYAAKSGGYCVVVNSMTLNAEDIAIWREVGPDGVGYNADCDCYCFGFKPKWDPPELIGLGRVAPPFSSSGDEIPPFKVCAGSGYASDGGCKDCGAPALDCPTCPKPPPALLPQQQSALDEWGTNLGWLLAGAVIAGGGYYAYKKGVFKKGYWKKIGKRRRR